MPRHKLGPQPEFMRRQPHGFLCVGPAYAFHLKQHFPGTNNRHPVVGSAFAFTHTGFSRLLRDRRVRKQTDPDLAAALDETRHRHTAGLDLTIGDPARLHYFQSVVSEGQLASAPGLTAHASALLLAVLTFFRH